jgi:transaldolase
MSQNLLEQLRTMTVVVADTGDIDAIEQFRPRDATTNPSLIAAAAQMDRYEPIITEALSAARVAAGHGATDHEIVAEAVDRLTVEFGLRILKLIPGRVSTEVDARLSFNREATIAKAHDIIRRYEAHGASRERILIKIASTWEGIEAAAELEREGIHCNLTLLFGMHQAVACAEAGVTLISPFVGRILDWHLARRGVSSIAPPDDPGVLSVTAIYNYYKHFGYKTEVMGASFRNMGEITELAGCDLLTIAPKLLAELQNSTGTLARKLDPVAAAGLDLERIYMERTHFDAAHAADPMSNEKLADGIHKFAEDTVKLEKLLAARL